MAVDGSHDISLHNFTATDAIADLQTYVEALTEFDAISELQELKQVERDSIQPDWAVLDIGCGFGLETERIARLVSGGPPVIGIDFSAHLIAEAQRRATAAGLTIDYRVGLAQQLPVGDAAFDHVRAERVLIYIDDVQACVDEMRRVLKPGGSLAIIEPTFDTTTVNVADRDLVARVMAHESKTAVTQSWLPGPLLTMLRTSGFEGVVVTTRVVRHPQALGGQYFRSCGDHAHRDGVITEDELAAWRAAVDALVATGDLFGSVDYFLFTARR
jgi:2-polyprenyl-3-methyl-5-hydroxy-6-metoxy-1,4-benzoquinol methylase